MFDDSSLTGLHFIGKVKLCGVWKVCLGIQSSGFFYSVS